VEIEENELEIKVQGLAPDTVYGVFLDDGTGTLAEVGTITTEEEGKGRIEFEGGEDDDGEGASIGHEGGEDDNSGPGDGDDDDHEDGDDDHGDDPDELPLPFGVANADQLAGRALEIRDGAGVVVLAGMTPDLRFEEDRENETDLSRPDPAPDEDAEGELELRQKDGRMVIKVEVENLDPLAMYEVTLTNPAGDQSESLGIITTKDNGEGKLKVDTRKGDPAPFGVGSLSELEGFVLAVKNASGATVLESTIGAVSPPDPPEEEEEGESCLIAADPASGASGEVEVEVEVEDGGEKEEELEVKARGLAPATVYDVVLTNPADSTTATAGQFTTNSKGRGELELGAGELPFGAQNVAALAGFGVTVQDAAGAAVLKGTVPALGDRADCDHGDDDGHDDDGHDDDDDERGHDGEGHGGGVALVPIDEFAVVGDFDTAFLRGDSNADGALDVSDAIHCLGYLFLGGQRPFCLDAADANDDGKVDIADPVGTLGYLFSGGSALPAPGIFIGGPDHTADSLHCLEVPAP
jgi:hypothetical protein